MIFKKKKKKDGMKSMNLLQLQASIMWLQAQEEEQYGNVYIAPTHINCNMFLVEAEEHEISKNLSPA